MNNRPVHGGYPDASLPPHDAVGVSEEVKPFTLLGDLLAVVHRDGGHYVMEHGWSKAAHDAEAKVVQWLTRDDADSSAPATPSAEPVAWQLRKHVNGVWRDWEPCRQADHEGIQAEAKHWGMQYESRALYASPTPVLADSRPPTTQEDQWLRDAAKRSSTLVAPGKLADGVLGGPVGAPIPAGVGEVDRG